VGGGGFWKRGGDFFQAENQRPGEGEAWEGRLLKIKKDGRLMKGCAKS